MNSGSFDAIAPGSASQLSALLAAVAGAALVAVALQGLLWLRNRTRGAPTTAHAPVAEPVLGARTLRRLLGAVLLGALLLPITAAMRQLWPHPDLGPRLLAVWLPLVAIPAAVWLLVRGDDRTRRPRP